MKILLTGAAGQIATALAQRLRALATLVITDRANLDLSKPETIPDVLNRLAADLIINTAAYTAVDRAEEEPELARLVNAEAPGAMALWASKQNVPIIHFSTDYIFGGSGERPQSEDEAPNPLSVYGATKLEGEQRILNCDAACLVVRTSWVYAARGSNFLRSIACLAATNEELRVVADQFGAPTSAALIADAVTAMLARGLDEFVLTTKQAGRVVQLAARGETSWHGFASEIVNGLRDRGVPLATKRVIPICSDEFPTLARRPRNSRLDLSKLQSVFGITTPHWLEALQPELDAFAAELRRAN
jgi:dTDP-4-dehydrorhamnose reductase